MKRLFSWTHGQIAVLALFASLSGTVSAQVTGSYTLGGATTGTGPWTMTSTDSTYSVLRFVFDTPVPFGSLTNINVDYNAILGGIGAGTPRLDVVFDNGQYLEINFGPAASFVDGTLGAANSGNLLAMFDTGRYDNQGIGGTFYSNYASAFAIASGYNVVRTSLVIDSFGGNNREFTINSINVVAVPEPATYAMMLAGLAAIGFSVLRRKDSGGAVT